MFYLRILRPLAALLCLFLRLLLGWDLLSHWYVFRLWSSAQILNHLQALGYTHREVFSVLFVAAAFWPAFYGMDFLNANKELVATWAVACTMMSSFTLLPAMKTEDVALM